MDCVFCKIVSGEISCRKVYETLQSLAFLDAFPLARGHILVIPKSHHVSVQELSREENADLFESVRIVTSLAGRISQSSLVAIHNGKEAGQEVPHVHVHVIPRNPSDGAGPVHSMFSKRPKLTESETDEIVKILKG